MISQHVMTLWKQFSCKFYWISFSISTEGRLMKVSTCYYTEQLVYWSLLFKIFIYAQQLIQTSKTTSGLQLLNLGLLSHLRHLKTSLCDIYNEDCNAKGNFRRSSFQELIGFINPIFTCHFDALDTQEHRFWLFISSFLHQYVFTSIFFPQ